MRKVERRRGKWKSGEESGGEESKRSEEDRGEDIWRKVKLKREDVRNVEERKGKRER